MTDEADEFIRTVMADMMDRQLALPPGGLIPGPAPPHPRVPRHAAREEEVTASVGRARP